MTTQTAHAAAVELALNPLIRDDESLRWVTPDGHQGPVRDLAHLRDLITLVGSADERRWLDVGVIYSDGTEGPFCQLCGDAGMDAIAVEISTGSWPLLAAPHGSPTVPTTDIGTHGWRYLAHHDELVDVSRAFALVTDWLIDRHVDIGHYDLRATEHRDAPRRQEGPR